MAIWRKILKDPLGAGGMSIILLAFFCALLAYAIVPDNSPNANRMHLSLSGMPPGFEMTMLRLPQHCEAQTVFEDLLYGQPVCYEEVPISNWQRSGDSLRYEPYPAGPLKFLDLSATYPHGFDPEQHFKNRTFWLGTDRFGRDLLSRILVGTRVSFSVGFVAVLISLLIGIPLGSLAGYYGGRVDKVIMWLINVVWSIPGLLLVIAITLALGKGFWQVFVAIGFTMWVEVARVVRGQILSVKEKEYVQAARVLGYSDLRILFRHILPNVTAPLIVISAANFAAAILVESGLSFLGIGAQPPMPSWGSMIKDHYAYLLVDKAYLALAPGLAIMILVLAFMVLGNALRDALDVRKVQKE